MYIIYFITTRKYFTLGTMKFLYCLSRNLFIDRKEADQDIPVTLSDQHETHGIISFVSHVPCSRLKLMYTSIGLNPSLLMAS